MKIGSRFNLARFSSLENSPEYYISRSIVASGWRMRWNFLLALRGGIPWKTELLPNKIQKEEDITQLLIKRARSKPQLSVSLDENKQIFLTLMATVSMLATSILRVSMSTTIGMTITITTWASPLLGSLTSFITKTLFLEGLCLRRCFSRLYPAAQHSANLIQMLFWSKILFII